MEGGFLVKAHDSYRMVVSICDKEIYGKKFVEGNRQLDLTGNFFKGDEFSYDEIIEKITDYSLDDATFNFAGERSVSLAVETGLIKKEDVLEVEGVKFALALL